MRILAVCGSLQSKSKNLTLLGTAARCVPPDVELVLFDDLGELPHFNPEIEATTTPDSVLRWRQALANSAGGRECRPGTSRAICSDSTRERR